MCILFLVVPLSWSLPATTTARNVPETELGKTDLGGILALLPRDKIKDIANKHLKSDEGFKAGIAYMKSKEWIDLVETIKAKPAWITFKNYIKNNTGFVIEIIQNCTRGFIDKATVSETLKYGNRTFKSFLEDVDQVIPTTKLMDAFLKRRNDKDFEKIIKKLSDKKFKKIVEDVLALPEVKKAVKELDKMGFEITEIFGLTYYFLGWGTFKM